VTEPALSQDARRIIIAQHGEMSGRQLAEMLGVSRTSVHRLIRELSENGVRRPSSVKTAANMEFVAANWASMNDFMMAEKLCVRPETVRKYRLDLGIRREQSPAIRSNATDQTRLVRMVDNRATDTADRAAEYLASFDRTPVFRITTDGIPHPKGNLWRYGTARLTTDEMMAKATRKGFDPDWWRRLAA